MANLLVLMLVTAATAVPWWLLRVPRELTTEPSSVAPPTISVIVPARDEEATLPALLASLAASAGPVAEVVVVDDGSRDRTAAIGRAARARVVPAGTPPAGWTGKAWACHTGASITTGDVLLFLDADTVLATDALGGLLRLHAAHGGLISVQPHHRVVRCYEHLSAVFNAVALLASGAFTGRPSARPMAFGPCLLTTRTDYQRVGGHATVRAEILDDVSLAVAYDDAGLPVTCALGGQAVTMRSYPGGLGQLVSGWTKNIASGAAACGLRAALATVLWISALHAVVVGTVLSLTGSSLAAGAPLVWVAGWVGLALGLRGVLRHAGSFAWWTWAAFPLPLLFFDLVFARSAALTVVRRSVLWRGRPVDLRRDGAPSPDGPSGGVA
ncbi:glycosyltransferase [Aeromicrobium sp.]|uniref:glycosyltransferase n=1 Tax=Aeromicrobium sp. TaxID=1871063 RepID=UPI0025C170AA|nr:glycosyltransferase [Aeromicrobium sp.]MCK5891793.1 glycosyltransferase [Aeromicrobium sp.]